MNRTKNFICSAILLALLGGSCQKNSSADKKTGEQNNNTAKTSSQDNSSTTTVQDAPSHQANKARKTIKDRVPEILAQEAFFAKLKDAKSDENVKLECSYEYIQKDGKEVLHGEACITSIGMGFGTNRCANFDNGQLHGLALNEVYTPATYRLRLAYSRGQLVKGRLERLFPSDCVASDYVQDKNLAELEKEFDFLLGGSSELNLKMKEVSCKEVESELPSAVRDK
jgi:hypothetical protein